MLPSPCVSWIAINLANADSVVVCYEFGSPKFAMIFQRAMFTLWEFKYNLLDANVVCDVVGSVVTHIIVYDPAIFTLLRRTVLTQTAWTASFWRGTGFGDAYVQPYSKFEYWLRSSSFWWLVKITFSSFSVP